MRKTRSFPFVLVLVVLILSACNNPMASQPGVWYNPFSWGDKTWTQTTIDAAAKCAQVGLEVLGINPDSGDPTCGTIAISIPSNSGDTYQNAACRDGASIISQSQDWTRMVVETDGRIWQDCLLDGSIRPAFTTTFTAPASGTYTYNGVNASLQYGAKVLAANVNGSTVTLVKGQTYTVINGETNGGIELLPLSQ